MKYILAFCLLAGGSALADELSLPASMSSLPPEVRSALVDVCHGCEFADAGAPWNATDVIVKDLPRRRLVRVAQAGIQWRVEYEHGGIGHHRHVLTFSTDPKVHVVSTDSCMPSEKCRDW